VFTEGWNVKKVASFAFLVKFFIEYLSTASIRRLSAIENSYSLSHLNNCFSYILTFGIF